MLLGDRTGFVRLAQLARVHVLLEQPVPGLLSLIGELRPGLVVVGSHGRGAVLRLLLGSVAEQLCRRSPVPVVVIPDPGRAAETQAQASG